MPVKNHITCQTSVNSKFAPSLSGRGWVGVWGGGGRRLSVPLNTKFPKRGGLDKISNFFRRGLLGKRGHFFQGGGEGCSFYKKRKATKI